MNQVCTTMDSEDAAIISGVLSAMRTDPELAHLIRTQVLDSKRGKFDGIIERAVRRGELPAGSTADLVEEVIPALVVNRLVIQGESTRRRVRHPCGGRHRRCRYCSTDHRPHPQARHEEPLMAVATDFATPDSPSGTGEPDPKRWLALAVIAVAQLMVVLDASIVTIALPSAQHVAAHLHRQPPVDGDRLHPRLRRPVAARRPHRRLRGPQAHLHRRPARLRRGVGPRRRGRQRPHALRGPRPPGCLRPPCWPRRPSRSSR